MCWASWTRGHPCRISNNVCLTQRTPVERTLMSSSLGDGCAPDAPSKWRRGTLLASWLSFPSAGPLMLQTSWASYCRVCRKDVSVLTHGGYERIRQFQGHRHFAHDQRLRLETPGWRVLDFDGNPLPEDAFERQWDKILLAVFVVRDREDPFREDPIPDASGNVDPQLPMMAKLSCLVDALQLGRSCELVEKLWERFVLTASRFCVTVDWSRDEVLVSSVSIPDCQCTKKFGLIIVFLF